MNKINVNKIIKKNTSIKYYKENNIYYLMIANIIIIKVEDFGLFTATSERKIKERMKEDKSVLTLYNYVKTESIDTNIKITNYIKKQFTEQYEVFKTKDFYKYIDVNFIELLKNDLLDYELYTTNKQKTSILFKHINNNISFIIAPAILDENKFKFKLNEEDEPE